MIPQVTSVISFFQLLGGALGISIAGTVFANNLNSTLAKFAPRLPNYLAIGVRQSISVIFDLPADLKAEVVVAYVSALDCVFIVGVPTMLASSLCVLMVKNYNVKGRGTEGTATGAT